MPAGKPFEVGDCVATQDSTAEGGDHEWYIGRIVHATPPREVKILYEDGSTWTGDAREGVHAVNTSASQGLLMESIAPSTTPGCVSGVRAQTIIFGSWIAAIVLLGAGVIFYESTPDGELPIWFELRACREHTGSREYTGPLVSYSLLRKTTVGVACPQVSSGSDNEQDSAAPIVRVPIEKDDGLFADAAYVPTFFLPSGSYAIISLTVVNQRGRTLLSLNEYTLSPNDDFPWERATSAHSLDSTTSSVSPPVPSSPPPDCHCTDREDACPYVKDGVCDDGGEGSRFSACTFNSDCSDCNAWSWPLGWAHRCPPQQQPGTFTGGEVGEMSLPKRVLTDTEPKGRLALGGRRLLKGGIFSSRGSVGDYQSGGRSRISGVERWGNAQLARSTIISRSPRSPLSIRAHPVAYGYFYGHAAIPAMTYALIVPRIGFNCYSCGASTYVDDDGSPLHCASHLTCKAAMSELIRFPVDRYELAAQFSANSSIVRTPRTLLGELVGSPGSKCNEGNCYPLWVEVYSLRIYGNSELEDSLSLPLYFTFTAVGIETLPRTRLANHFFFPFAFSLIIAAPLMVCAFSTCLPLCCMFRPWTKLKDRRSML